MSAYLAIDLGSTKISLSLWTPEGTRLRGVRFPSPPGGHERGLAAIVDRARELIGNERIERIGVSAGGPVDPRSGVLLSVPNLDGWENAPIGDGLSRALGVEARVENDANACALAEWRHGAGRGVRDLVFMTFSTGLGAGLILDGRLYRGHRFLAGEIGHVVIDPEGPPCGCGARGCLEAMVSGSGIRRRLDTLRRDDPSLPSDARELVERARAGDVFSRDFLASVARTLARGIAATVFLLNPARVVLGTIAVGAGDLILEPLRAELGRIVWPSLRAGLEVVPAALGEDLGDHAAFAVAQGE